MVDPKSWIAITFFHYMYMTRLTTGFLIDHGCFVSPPCHCMPDGVDCSSMSIDYLPLFDTVIWNTSILNLQMDNNNLTSVDDDAFSNIAIGGSSNINLYLEHNQISQLSDFCFRGVEDSVYSINLTDNRLTHIPKAFGNLTKLFHLYLNKNPITILDSFTMSEIGRNLHTLEIDMSHFPVWPTELHYLRYLFNLVLYGIPYDNLHYDAFIGFENILTSLAIVGSDLDELPVAICHLTRLNQLDFEYNYKLVSNTLHTESCHVENLGISMKMKIVMRNNNLVQFPKLLSTNAHYRTVDVGNNQIGYIEDNIIPKCSISYMHLDHNNLTRVPHALQNLESIYSLDLSYNQILSLEDTLLGNLKLPHLNLKGNKIRYISKQALVNKDLRSLDLSDNNLMRVPESLKYVLPQGTIHLDGNPISCDCLDFDPTTWNATQVAVTGMCDDGLETIDSFLANVTQICP